jgi:hypothetical protein
MYDKHFEDWFETKHPASNFPNKTERDELKANLWGAFVEGIRYKENDLKTTHPPLSPRVLEP